LKSFEKDVVGTLPIAPAPDAVEQAKCNHCDELRTSLTEGSVAAGPRENRTMPDHAAPLTDADIHELDTLLAGVPPPLEPLDVSALDGYLCGVLLQPQPVPEARWLRHVVDIDQGRQLPAGPAAGRIAAIARRRHAELAAAIDARRWFDPWVFELEPEGHAPPPAPHQSTLPWVAGFAAALERFPALLALEDPALIEPLAVVYAAFDPEDLVDAEDLLPTIETLEPPADLAQAAEDLVRSVLLMADVSRPRRAPRRPPGGRRPRP
jgi:uncharacterized protein